MTPSRSHLGSSESSDLRGAWPGSVTEATFSLPARTASANAVIADDTIGAETAAVPIVLLKGGERLQPSSISASKRNRG